MLSCDTRTSLYVKKKHVQNTLVMVFVLPLQHYTYKTYITLRSK